MKYYLIIHSGIFENEEFARLLEQRDLLRFVELYLKGKESIILNGSKLVFYNIDYFKVYEVIKPEHEGPLLQRAWYNHEQHTHFVSTNLKDVTRKFILDKHYGEDSEIDSLPKTKGNDYFFESHLISELKAIGKPKKYSTKLLIEYIEEIDFCYRNGKYLSSIIVARALLNFIPPIFQSQRFFEIIPKHDPNPKKGKNELFEGLENGLRKMGDLKNHKVISPHDLRSSKAEIEPYKPHFDYLIKEIIAILKSI